jgi:hypothetical protein
MEIKSPIIAQPTQQPFQTILSSITQPIHIPFAIINNKYKYRRSTALSLKLNKYKLNASYTKSEIDVYNKLRGNIENGYTIFRFEHHIPRRTITSTSITIDLTNTPLPNTSSIHGVVHVVRETSLNIIENTCGELDKFLPKPSTVDGLTSIPVPQNKKSIRLHHTDPQFIDWFGSKTSIQMNSRKNKLFTTVDLTNLWDGQLFDDYDDLDLDFDDSIDHKLRNSIGLSQVTIYVDLYVENNCTLNLPLIVQYADEHLIIKIEKDIRTITDHCNNLLHCKIPNLQALLKQQKTAYIENEDARRILKAEEIKNSVYSEETANNAMAKDLKFVCLDTGETKESIPTLAAATTYVRHTAKWASILADPKYELTFRDFAMLGYTTTDLARLKLFLSLLERIQIIKPKEFPFDRHRVEDVNKVGIQIPVKFVQTADEQSVYEIDNNTYVHSVFARWCGDGIHYELRDNDNKVAHFPRHNSGANCRTGDVIRDIHISIHVPDATNVLFTMQNPTLCGIDDIKFEQSSTDPSNYTAIIPGVIFTDLWNSSSTINGTFTSNKLHHPITVVSSYYSIHFSSEAIEVIYSLQSKIRVKKTKGILSVSRYEDGELVGLQPINWDDFPDA